MTRSTIGKNFQQLIPILDPVMARFATTKVISWQHFERVRWDAKEAALRVSSSDAPTGGSNNSWNRQDLEKIFTLYLGDRTFHRYIWNKDTGPLAQPPLHKRGYVFHYSTTVLGNIERLKPLRTTNWYNRETDFRFQIPYFFGQFQQANMLLEFCFKDGWLRPADQEALVRGAGEHAHAVEIYRRTGLGPGAFVHTLERTLSDRPKDRPLWQRIA